MRQDMIEDINGMLDRVNNFFGFRKYAIRDEKYLDEYNIVGGIIIYSLLTTQESIYFYISGMHRVILYVDGI